jgi:hypothetical protein
MNIRIITPQFERPANWPKPKTPNWKTIRRLTRKQLLNLGMGKYDKKLLLFPGEWYDLIPEGFKVAVIDGTTEEFKKGVTDNDTRFGFLAYGIIRNGPRHRVR